MLISRDKEKKTLLDALQGMYSGRIQAVIKMDDLFHRI